MGWFSTLFPEQPRGRKPHSQSTPPPKRRRQASIDALAQSFADASIARQAALSQSQPAAYPVPSTSQAGHHRHSTPLSSSTGGLYRQELVTPYPVQDARPPPPKVWQAPPEPSYANPFLPVYRPPDVPPRPLPQVPRPASMPTLAYAPPATPPRAVVMAPAPSPKRAKPKAVETGAKNQCRGTKANGERCTRIVGSANSAPSSPAKKGKRTSLPQQQLTEANLVQLNRVLSRKGRAAAPDSDSEDSEGEELARFCHQHSKAAMEEPGTFAGSRGTWIRYEDWIPADLPDATRLQLRYELTRPPTAGDKPGYLYVHEMARTSSSDPTTYLKVGRSIRPVKRLSQWKSQCPSRTPIVRGLFPLPDGTDGATLGGALAVNPVPAPFHHRWERLVLIEIAGRATLMGGEGKGAGKCVDCGKQHSELFLVERGAYEHYVIDIIQRWQKWCTEIL